MIVIVDMQMPESCLTCPFFNPVIGAANCIARSQYISPGGGRTFDTPLIYDGNDEQRDSSCPLYDDTTIDAALEEIAQLRNEVKRLTEERNKNLTPPAE